MIDYKKAYERFTENLDYEISQQTDAFHVMFMLHHQLKGNMTQEDAIELRGYYKGLKVAREILQKIINIMEEEDEWLESQENEVTE